MKEFKSIHSISEAGFLRHFAHNTEHYDLWAQCISLGRIQTSLENLLLWISEYKQLKLERILLHSSVLHTRELTFTFGMDIHFKSGQAELWLVLKLKKWKHSHHSTTVTPDEFKEFSKTWQYSTVIANAIHDWLLR